MRTGAWEQKDDSQQSNKKGNAMSKSFYVPPYFLPGRMADTKVPELLRRMLYVVGMMDFEQYFTTPLVDLLNKLIEDMTPPVPPDAKTSDSEAVEIQIAAQALREALKNNGGGTFTLKDLCCTLKADININIRTASNELSRKGIFLPYVHTQDTDIKEITQFLSDKRTGSKNDTGFLDPNEGMPYVAVHAFASRAMRTLPTKRSHHIQLVAKGRALHVFKHNLSAVQALGIQDPRMFNKDNDRCCTDGTCQLFNNRYCVPAEGDGCALSSDTNCA